MDRPRNVGTRWTTEYLVTVTSDVGSVEGGGWYAAGSQATLRAPADQTSGGQSYSFSGWTGDVTSKETSVTVTVDHPMSAREIGRASCRGGVDVAGGAGELGGEGV